MYPYPTSIIFYLLDFASFAVAFELFHGCRSAPVLRPSHPQHRLQRN